MGLPSVCSPRREFRDLVEHGVDGFLAETDAEWLDALRALAGNAGLRARIGAACSTRVLARYAPETVATTQLLPLVKRLEPIRRAKVRVLVVNIFFAPPHSFGGATIVAEEIEIAPAYTQNNIDAFFADIDVLLFPSQWKESYGLTVREALVRDVWVIATDCGAAAEEIVEGVNGNVVPLGDEPGPLAKAITDVLDRADTIRSHVNPLKNFLRNSRRPSRGSPRHSVWHRRATMTIDDLWCFSLAWLLRKVGQPVGFVGLITDCTAAYAAEQSGNFDIGCDSNRLIIDRHRTWDAAFARDAALRVATF